MALARSHSRKRVLFLGMSSAYNTNLTTLWEKLFTPATLSVDSEACAMAGLFARSDTLISKFELHIQLNVLADQLRPLLTLIRPQILHISGHMSLEGLVLETSMTGHPEVLSSGHLSRIIRGLGVRLVVLNGCQTGGMLSTLLSDPEGPWVAVGHSDVVTELAANEFSRRFYDELSAGENLSVGGVLAAVERTRSAGYSSAACISRFDATGNESSTMMRDCPLIQLLQHADSMDDASRATSDGPLTHLLHNAMDDAISAKISEDDELCIALRILSDASSIRHDAMSVGRVRVGCLEHVVERSIKAFAIARHIGDKGIALSLLGDAYAACGDHRHAMHFYVSALHMSQKMSDKVAEGDRLTRVGNCYAAMGDLVHAIEFYERAVAISSEIGDTYVFSAAVRCNLASVLAASGNYSRAIDCYNSALLVTRSVGEKKTIGIVLHGLGNCFAATDELIRAMTVFEEALCISREQGDKIMEVAILGNLGNVHAAMGDPHRAKLFFGKASAISNRTLWLEPTVGTLPTLAVNVSTTFKGDPAEIDRLFQVVSRNVFISKILGNDAAVLLSLKAAIASLINRGHNGLLYINVEDGNHFLWLD